MSNSFGQLFRITTSGESHGPAISVVIDGCPAGIPLAVADIQQALDRRRPGQSRITTQRKEKDLVQIQSGWFEGQTTGTPIHLTILNEDARSQAYDKLKGLYRPSHADYTYDQRYGIRDWRGGGRASNRESAARVAAGAVANQLILNLTNIEVLAWVEQIHQIKATLDLENLNREQIEQNPVRCPNQACAKQMEAAIIKARKDGDSLGGFVGFCVKNCPSGLGSPVFGKLNSDLGQALLSINATRSFELGLGQKAVELTGSEHNDSLYLDQESKVRTKTNQAGGIVGGISNGEMIYGRVSFKPTATIRKNQATLNTDHQAIEFSAAGRHDPCVLPRAVPIVEAMVQLVLADHLLQYAVCRLSNLQKVFQ